MVELTIDLGGQYISIRGPTVNFGGQSVDVGATDGGTICWWELTIDVEGLNIDVENLQGEQTIDV